MHVIAATNMLFNLLSSYTFTQWSYIHIAPVLQKAEQQYKHHLPTGNLKFKLGILNCQHFEAVDQQDSFFLLYTWNSREMLRNQESPSFMYMGIKCMSRTLALPNLFALKSYKLKVQHTRNAAEMPTSCLLGAAELSPAFRLKRLAQNSSALITWLTTRSLQS